MKKLDLTLYLITDRTNMSDEIFLGKVEAACRGGVTLVQLREKDCDSLSYYNIACKLKKVTDKFNIPLIIDDRVDVALAVDAAGVHVGKSDLPVALVRHIIGENKIVGATAKTVDQALKAQIDGADYVGVGAIYPTTTKVKTIITKVSTLNEICHAIHIPVVAIGGLNADNCAILKESPIDGIAVVSAIMKQSDSELAALTLRKKVNDLCGK